jgi:hypothetical protein
MLLCCEHHAYLHQACCAAHLHLELWIDGQVFMKMPGVCEVVLRVAVPQDEAALSSQAASAVIDCRVCFRMCRLLAHPLCQAQQQTATASQCEGEQIVW